MNTPGLRAKFPQVARRGGKIEALLPPLYYLPGKRRQDELEIHADFLSRKRTRFVAHAKVDTFGQRTEGGIYQSETMRGGGIIV